MVAISDINLININDQIEMHLNNTS